MKHKFFIIVLFIFISINCTGQILIRKGCNNFGEIVFVLQSGKPFGWGKKGEKKSLLHTSYTGNPRGNAVYRGIEIIGCDKHSVKRVASYDFLCYFLGFVVEDYYVVGIPAHSAGDVESYLFVEEKKR